jgi:uncharacterized protein YkwD
VNIFFSQKRIMTTTTDETQAMLTLINNYRAQQGAPPLQLSPRLTQAAQWMANDMASNNFLSHNDSLGRDPFTRMATYGYPSDTPRGENIAAGDPDAQSTFNSWLDACDPSSSGVCTHAHRQNILNRSFRAIGIGRASNPSSQYHYYWTTDFGGVVDTTQPVAPTRPPVQSIVQPTIPPSQPTGPLVQPTIPPNQSNQPGQSIIPVATVVPMVPLGNTGLTGPVGTLQPSLIGVTGPTGTVGPQSILPGSSQAQVQPGVLVGGQCLCPTTAQFEVMSTGNGTGTMNSHLWIIIVIILLLIIGAILVYYNRSTLY